MTTNYVLDTNHASAIWKADPKVLTRIGAAHDVVLHLCLPSVAELWYMVFNSSRVAENEVRLRTFLNGFPILPLDDAAAEEFGRIKSELRRSATPIPDVDALIAAVARSRDMVVLTADAHFGRVPDLRLENWTT
jgi:tRNA(fMet)-specific endonuclease VapC